MTTTDLHHILNNIKATIANLNIGDSINGTTTRYSDFWVERFEQGYEVSLVTETIFSADIKGAANLSLDAYLNC